MPYQEERTSALDLPEMPSVLRWHTRAMVLVAAAIIFHAIATLCAGQPNIELAHAVDDQRTLPAELVTDFRYLATYNIEEGELRDKLRVATSMVANGASRTALIVKPTEVQPTLLRIRLSDYGWTPDLWEALIADGEPYWHITTEVATKIKQGNPVLTGYYRLRTTAGESEWYTAQKIQGWIKDGSLGSTREIQSQGGEWTTVAQILTPIEVAETQIVQTDGSWLDPQLVSALQAASGSRGAIARADWFVAKLCEPDHYYAFAGIGKTRGEHYAALGVDEKQVATLLIEKGTNIQERGPTRKPGRVIRFNSLLGGVWATYDINNDNVGIKDPIDDPTRAFELAGHFDAGESFIQGLNGLWQFDLYDDKGNIVGEANSNVATDSTAPSGEGTLLAPISCLRCHAQRSEGGIIDLTWDQQETFARADLKAADPAEIVRLQALYGRTERLKIEMERDRDDADAAAKEATGLTWKEAALAVAAVNDQYVYGKVTKDVVKRELAIEDETLLRASTSALVIRTIENHGFVGMHRGQWEKAFAEAAAITQSRK